MSAHGMSKPAQFGQRRRRISMALVMMLAVGMLSVMAVGYVRHGGSSHASTSGVTTTGSTLVQAANGPGWSVSLAPAYQDGDFLISLAWDAQPARVELLNSKTGQLQASIAVSYNPLVVRRATAHELLISDEVISQSGSKIIAGPRLLVFDLANKLALKRTISLPNRASYNVYGPQAAELSQDEHHLFYLVHESLCTGDAASCDKMSVATVDLSTDAMVQTTLPQNCGYAALHASGADSVIAACHNVADVLAIGPDGRVAQEDNFAGAQPTERVTGLPGGPVSAIFGFRTSQGQLGMLLANGTMIARGADGSLVSAATVPAGFRVNPTGQVYQLGPDTLAIAYVGQGGAAPQGIVVVDPGTGKVQRTVRLENTQYVVPHNGSLVELKTDQTLGSVDLTAGTVSAQVGHTSTGAKALIP